MVGGVLKGKMANKMAVRGGQSSYLPLSQSHQIAEDRRNYVPQFRVTSAAAAAWLV